MSPFDPAFDPPAPLATARFVLEPLGAEHAERDYEAIMGCRERLRAELRWSGWPPEGFTLEDNRADLAEHRGEFDRREEYAYTVLHPSGATCLGCVYLEPLERAARLAFWVTDPALALEAELVDAVLRWIEVDWPIERVVVPLRPDNQRATETLRGLGLTPVSEPAVEGHVAFARPRGG